MTIIKENNIFIDGIQKPMMTCRTGCGACCVAPTISSPIPGMPNGKPAGVRCIQLSADNACLIFNDIRRPAVCSEFNPSQDVCLDTREQALNALSEMENATNPHQTS